MKIAPFATEHFFARYEFNTPYQLCNSDCETLTVDELLALAGIPLAELSQLALGYTESQGNPELRRMIAAQYETVAPDDVVVLGTPIEGIYLAARALLEPGDEVIALSPAYDALTNMFAHIVGEQGVKQWTFTETADGWALDFDRLDALVTDRTRLLVVNFPHNPTGYLPTRAQLDALAAFAEQHDLWLFYDEMYYGLVHSGTPAIPSAADVTERAVVLSGLSKTYGLPGLRTGWLIVKDEALRQALINWKFYTSICPPVPSEFLAMAALRAAEAIRERNIAIIERNRDLFAAFAARWDDLFTWHPPMAGSVALVRVNVPSVTEWAARLADEAGVLIHPAATLGGSGQHMRIGLGRVAFPEALAQFEAYLQQKGVS